MKKILASFVFILTIALGTKAQDTLIRPSALGVSFFLNDFTTAQRIRSSSLNTVIREKTWAKFREMSPGLALTYFKGVQKHIDFAGTLAASFPSTPVVSNPNAGRDGLFLEADASFNFKMFSDRYIFTPYLIAGVGGSKYKSYYGAFVPLGGGFKFNLFDEASVFITLQYRVPVISETNNYHFFTSVGVSGILGKKKERVVPPPPPPPADTDGDGIFDSTDQCPAVPGLAKYNGCPVPDTDKDGINDEQDQCPTVPGMAKYNGCPVPDTDKDGINDEEDKCPSVPGVARYQGCPVPDTDGDGVNDEEDKCPTLAGTRENNGCPEVKQEIVKKMEYAAKRIFFVTGSAKLSTKSNAALNEIVKILNDDKDLKLSIEGHTDNVGKADFNKDLSDKRANSVRTYLVGKGIDEARLTAIGFGLEQPIADNKTAAGRAKNRRVELKLNY
ncbi:MAG TPA: OmpA family protein [Flavisolibacter sp.]|jgi:outer membrane protein OmpA-like peptidoglycan-associated protein|nr:OmpA family protein [Flavisolibacter sp.]